MYNTICNLFSSPRNPYYVHAPLQRDGLRQDASAWGLRHLTNIPCAWSPNICKSVQRAQLRVHTGLPHMPAAKH